MVVQHTLYICVCAYVRERERQRNAQTTTQKDGRQELSAVFSYVHVGKLGSRQVFGWVGLGVNRYTGSQALEQTCWEMAEKRESILK